MITTAPPRVFGSATLPLETKTIGFTGNYTNTIAASAAATSETEHVKDTESLSGANRQSTSRVNNPRPPFQLMANTQKANKDSRLRPPSLRQISQHYINHASAAATASDTTTAPPATKDSVPTTTETIVPAASMAKPLSDVTTAAPTARLQLPPSAMTRANLSSSFVKAAAAAVNPKEAAKGAAKAAAFPVETAKTAAATDESENEGSSASTASSDHRRARQSLGHGLPGISLLETPKRLTKADNGAGPELVIINSTPERTTEREPIEPRFTNENGEHPLAHRWTLFYDSKTYKPDADTFRNNPHLQTKWEAKLLNVGTIDSVEGFARHMNNIKLPSALPMGASYHLFKDGILPMWEHPANENGGKWAMFFRGSSLCDMAWANLVMSLIGEMLDADDMVCGIVASARPRMNRIQVWTRVVNDLEQLNDLAKRILALGFDEREMDNVSLEFQPNASNISVPEGLLKISFPSAAMSRTSSLANIGGGSSEPSVRRSPSSPVGFGTPPSPTPGPHLTTPHASSAPMRRTSSGGVFNAFSGPLGVPRRLASTTAEDLNLNK